MCKEKELELVIIRGLPGSGKSTKARTEFPDHLHYENDQYFCDTHGRYRWRAELREDAKKWVFTMADCALARGESVVVSDVMPKLSSLEPFRELAEAHKAKLTVITCKESFGNVHGVPLTVLKAMKEAFEDELGEQTFTNRWNGDLPMFTRPTVSPIAKELM
jgi:predicted kinase